MSEDLEEQADDWIGLLASGDVRPEDVEALERWRRYSPAHAQAFLEARIRWKQLRAAATERRDEKRLAPIPQASPSFSRRVLLFGGGSVLAASAWAMVRPPFGLWPSLEELRADYRTATGEQRLLALDDTSVQMNTQTHIARTGFRINPPGRTRELRLISGEAIFATSSAFDDPLTVRAGIGSCKAARARLDMRLLGDAVRVTCLQGQVRIEHPQGRCDLAPDEQLTYDNARLHAAIPANPDLLSWQHGIIVFNDTPIRAAIEEVNRYRPGRVVLLARDLKVSVLTGEIRIEHIDAALPVIARTIGATLHAFPGGVAVLT